MNSPLTEKGETTLAIIVIVPIALLTLLGTLACKYPVIAAIVEKINGQ